MFSRREHPIPGAHSNVEVIGLFRAPTVSSIDSDATIDNQPGAGRTVGLVFSHLGSGLEGAINKQAQRLGVGPNAPTVNLDRIDTVSSIDTNATINDQPGAGRTVGRVLFSLGSKLENVMNKRAERGGLGPKAIAEEICIFARHRRIWIEETFYSPRWSLPVAPGRRFNKSETKALQKLSQKLIGHARSHVASNQLIALEEIIELSIKDPRIRAIFARSNIEQLITHYDEPDLLWATQRALGAIEFSDVHRIWDPIISLCLKQPKVQHHKLSVIGAEDLRIMALEEGILKTFRNPTTSFLSARYYKSVLDTLMEQKYLSGGLIQLLKNIGALYITVSIQQLASIEFSTFLSCVCLSSTRPYPLHPRIIKLADNFDFEELVRLTSSFLISTFPSDPDHICFYNDLDNLVHLISNITKSSSFRTHLSFLNCISNNARRCLEGSIFTEKASYTYYFIMYHIIKSGRDDHRFFGDDTLKDMCAPLISTIKLDQSNDLAATFIMKFCAFSRYCKAAALQVAQEISAETHFSLQQIVTSLACDNVRERAAQSFTPEKSTLLRIQILCPQIGRYCIFRILKSRRTPEESFINYQKRRQLKVVISADIITLDEKATFISVDGDLEPFRATGHYPVLAFHSDDQQSRPSYIARVTDCGDYYYTHVEEGGSIVSYEREEYNLEGDIEITKKHTSKFEVQVLRYDPLDYRSAQIEGELKDPTGPLGWINLYTEFCLADFLN